MSTWHIRLHNRKGFRREIEHGAIERFDFGTFLFGHRREVDAGFEVWRRLLEACDPGPARSLNDQLDRAFGPRAIFLMTAFAPKA